MIAADAAADRVAVSGRDAAGAVAYIDAEWLPRDGTAPVPALLARDRSLAWWADGGGPRPLGDGDAASAIASLAARAAASVPGSARSVEVLGTGAVAALVAEILGSRAAAGGDPRPDAIVDTTGDPGRLVDATARLADLGTLVLAGEARDPLVDLDVYVDLHARGLRVHGVPMVPPGEPPEGVGGPRPAAPADATADGNGRALLVPGAAWYAVRFP